MGFYRPACQTQSGARQPTTAMKPVVADLWWLFHLTGVEGERKRDPYLPKRRGGNAEKARKRERERAGANHPTPVGFRRLTDLAVFDFFYYDDYMTKRRNINTHPYICIEGGSVCVCVCVSVSVRCFFVTADRFHSDGGTLQIFPLKRNTCPSFISSGPPSTPYRNNTNQDNSTTLHPFDSRASRNSRIGLRRAVYRSRNRIHFDWKEMIP